MHSILKRRKIGEEKVIERSTVLVLLTRLEKITAIIAVTTVGVSKWRNNDNDE